MSTERPHGSWPSTLSAAALVEGAVRLTRVRSDGTSLYWDEGRPTTPPATAVVRSTDGRAVDVIEHPDGVRTTAHEYGGGGWWLHGSAVVYSRQSDGELRTLDGRTSRRIGPADVSAHAERFADGTTTPDGRWTVCVREDHRGDGEPRNEVVALPLVGGSVRVLVSGPDFVSFPRVSPDGRALAWTQWNHPDMPWDGTELWVGALEEDDDGLVVSGPRRVAGGREESVFQPEWSPAGRLHFVTDRTNWWNLRRFVEPGLPGPGDEPEPLHDQPVEVATPQWVFDMSRYAFVEADPEPAGDVEPIAFAAAADGRDTLWLLGADRSTRRLDVPHSAIQGLTAHRGGVAYVGATFTSLAEVVHVPVDGLRPDAEGPIHRVVRAPESAGLDPTSISVPESISFPTGPEGADEAHALYYPPTNPGSHGPAGERPPLVVSIHGGPTAAARSQLRLEVQYWTSRGFAVVDVNYRGSTGYGRAYRHLLDGSWGVADVEDCAAAASHLAERGDVDVDRLVIHGGSAGGFTTLAALAFTDVFAVGCSSYGVADLEALARDTHKFESRYLDRLVGPYPEARETYLERSPLTHVDRLDRPLLVLQGGEDKVVPPNQAEMIVEAVASRGVPVAYLLFEKEGHGFRRRETIIRALEAEFVFYAAVLGFEPADDIEPLEIRNG